MATAQWDAGAIESARCQVKLRQKGNVCAISFYLIGNKTDTRNKGACMATLAVDLVQFLRDGNDTLPRS
jgi:hypothetical protein